jgi:DNA-binding NtrC family response regulator
LVLAEIEKAAIIEVLARNQGDRRNTAEQLGISLRTLQYRLKDYGITSNMLSESGTDEDSDQKGTKTGPG